jgi:hypothetical protein
MEPEDPFPIHKIPTLVPDVSSPFSGVPGVGVGVGGVFNPPLNSEVLTKAEPNSQFRRKCIRNCLVFLFHHPN